MKRIIIAVTLVLLIALTACTPAVVPTATVAPTEPSDQTTSPAEPTATPEPTPIPTPISQADPFEWVENNDAAKEMGYSTQSLVSIDSLGRVLAPAGADKEDKEVGIFYTCANGFHTKNGEGVYDVTKIIAEYGVNAVFKEASPISPDLTEHWWGEPLFGYYDSTDTYIIRKHIEEFTAAGIDYIVMDVTNGWIYSDAVNKMAKYIIDLQEQGWNPPKLMYYCHSLSNKTVRWLYDDMYKNGRYDAAWYKRDGKPAIIAYTDPAKDKAEAADRGVTDFSVSDYDDLSEEIMNYFFFVEPRWPSDSMYWNSSKPYYDLGKKTGYNWIEWTQPLPVRDTSLGTFMNVATASHPAIPFSKSLTSGALNWGRGYNVKTGVNDPEGIIRGDYFQSCWDQAIEKSPDTVFIPSWNFWTALKQTWDGEYMLCDACTLEYSFCIEPSTGGYDDAFYLQMMSNMRKYKNEPAVETVRIPYTIDINGGFSQWYNIFAVYRQIGDSVYGRSGRRSDKTNGYYKVAKPENNLQEMRVAHDADNLYFMLRCGEEIVNDSENNMNLIIGTGSENDGWNAFDYILGKTVTDGKTDIIKLNADFTGEKCGDAEVVTRGNFMFIKVPRQAVGMTDSVDFFFKAADSVEDPSNIMSYYSTGSVMPLGRLAYSYKGQ